MDKPPPLQVAVDTDLPKGLKLSVPWAQWFSVIFEFFGRLSDYAYPSIQTPLTGFSITVGSTTKVLTLTPAGTLATGTIVMPANPVNGQPLQVSTTQTVTALTVTANVGQTIKNAPTTLVAGSGFSYYYGASSATWYRLY